MALIFANVTLKTGEIVILYASRDRVTCFLIFLYLIHLVWSLVEIAIRFIRGSLSLISRLISEMSREGDAEIHTLFFLNGATTFSIVKNRCFQDSQAVALL